MAERRVASVLALLFVFFAQTAQAFWDPPYITPENPVSGETVSINVYMGICDAVFNREGFPRITHEGNAIHVVVFGVHWEPGDLCTYPPGSGALAIGEYVPGDYVVTFDMYYIDFFSQPQTLTLGVVAFSIAGVAPPAVAAPTLKPSGLLVLLLVMSGVALGSLRSRRAGAAGLQPRR